MMPKVAVYVRPDGGVSYWNPWPRTDDGTGPETFDLFPPGRMGGEPEDDYVRRTADVMVPAGLVYTLIDTAALPSRRFRNAWRKPGTAVVVDLPAARALRRAELLRARRSWLAKLGLLVDVAVAKNQTSRANQLRTKRTNALAKDGGAIETDLAGVNDLNALSTYTPSALVDDEEDPD